MIKWSCYFHDKYTRLTEGEDVATDARWEWGHGDVPSIKEYTPWLHPPIQKISVGEF
jgi:hypothetical protein